MANDDMGHPEDFEQAAPGSSSPNEFFLERPRLTRLFEQARRRRLVSVCAGAGYGKTSAVYSFLRKYRHNKALIPWVQLSERDNLEASFWDSYIHAVYDKVPDWLESLLEIGIPKTKHDYEKYFSFVRAIFPTIAERYSEYIIVFDDLHTVTNPNVLQFIDHAVRFKSLKRTIFLLSRRDPLVILPHLVTEGIIPGVTEDDLRFTESEITEYLRQLGVSMSTQGLQDIYKDTRGWAFALALIGRSLQKSPEYRNDIFRAMKNNLFKIFEVEIFDVISEQLKNFFVRISLLDRLHAGLLNELASDDTMMAEMEQQSAYVRYDPYMNAYIVHQLFLSYLRDHQHLLTEKDKRDIYKKAGEYCERNNYKTDAISYYEKAGDFISLTNLVHNKISTQIPENIAENLLRIFENAPARMAKTVDLFPVLHLRTLLSLGRITEAIELGKRYEKQFLARPEPKKNTRILASIYLGLGAAHEFNAISEDKYDFSVYYMKLHESFNKNPFPTTGATALLMTGTWVTSIGVARAGAPEEFIAECERSEPYLINAMNGYGAGRSDTVAGELQFYRNNIREAERLLKLGLQKARTYRQSSLILKALFYLMRIAFLRGDAAGAARALSEMKDVLSDEDYHTLYASYDSACGWYYLKLGQLEFVQDWLKSDFLSYAYPKFVENYGNQTKMLYYFTTRNYAPLLSFTGRRKERETILFERLESQAIEACAYYHIKDKRAFETLREAYETAAPNRLLTPLIEMGKDMRALTAAALRDNDCRIPKTWLKSLNRQASVYAKFLFRIVKSTRSSNVKSEFRLSDREKEVLAGISRGLSRKELAENLGISHNAIKMITSSLYGKIGAFNMADAIRIGAEKNLI